MQDPVSREAPLSPCYHLRDRMLALFSSASLGVPRRLPEVAVLEAESLAAPDVCVGLSDANSGCAAGGGPVSQCFEEVTCALTCCQSINPNSAVTSPSASTTNSAMLLSAHNPEVSYYEQTPAQVVPSELIDNMTCPLMPDCWTAKCAKHAQLNCLTYGGWEAQDRFEALAAKPRAHRNVLLVSRFNENLWWLTPLLGLIDELHVWNKGDACRTDVFAALNKTGALRLTSVQNGGRDGHTFLEFAAQQAEWLRAGKATPANIYFVQGCPAGHMGQLQSLSRFQDRMAELLHAPTLPQTEMFGGDSGFYMLNPFLISADEIANQVQPLYKGVDASGRISLFSEMLGDRIQQTARSHVEGSKEAEGRWRELGMSSPQDAARDPRDFVTVAGYSHRMHGAIRARQR